MAVLLQAGLHNKYCVKKARWEEHLRTVQEEEEIITEMYREYKVNSHNSKFRHLNIVSPLDIGMVVHKTFFDRLCLVTNNHSSFLQTSVSYSGGEAVLKWSG